MFRYFFWLLIVTLLLFISYHLIPALHVYITDRNLKYIRRYRGFMDDDVFHIPPELEPSHPFREWLERDNRPARGAEWGSAHQDGPCKSMPEDCYWYDSMLYCKSHLRR